MIATQLPREELEALGFANNEPAVRALVDHVLSGAGDGMFDRIALLVATIDLESSVGTAPILSQRRATRDERRVRRLFVVGAAGRRTRSGG